MDCRLRPQLQLFTAEPLRTPDRPPPPSCTTAAPGTHGSSWQSRDTSVASRTATGTREFLTSPLFHQHVSPPFTYTSLLSQPATPGRHPSADGGHPAADPHSAQQPAAEPAQHSQPPETGKTGHVPRRVANYTQCLHTANHLSSTSGHCRLRSTWR